MSQYLECDVEELKSKNSYWTAREICQQPRVWREAYAAIESGREAIDSWLSPILAKPNLRIILSGAGTSAFIGETLAPWLRKRLGRRVEAVSTTDIVSDPGQYLAEDIPTLMISFARSGDSPESVASVDFANQILTDSYHLVLTCNPDGYLARSASSHNNMLCLLMPDGTNDRSFAMTSSFSSMLVSCVSIFSPDYEALGVAVTLADRVINNHVSDIKSIANRTFNRLVVLGAGSLQGVAREASLKCLELSAGKVVPMYDSPLGFRHGPKSVVDKSTLIIHLQSSEAYISAYDSDLLKELSRDNQASQLIALSPKALSGEDISCEDHLLSLPYIVYCQILAFFKAQALNITADNPCPGGEVNRVVQGVIIHPFQSGLKT